MSKVAKVFGVFFIGFFLFGCGYSRGTEEEPAEEAPAEKAPVTIRIASQSKSVLSEASRAGAGYDAIVGITIDGEPVIPDALEAVFISKEFGYNFSFMSDSLSSFNISVPPGKYDIVFLVGLNGNFVGLNGNWVCYLLASGYVSDYELISGVTNNINISLKAVAVELRHPESITYGQPVSASITVDTKNPFIVVVDPENPLHGKLPDYPSEGSLPFIEYFQAPAPDGAVFSPCIVGSVREKDTVYSINDTVTAAYPYGTVTARSGKAFAKVVIGLWGANGLRKPLKWTISALYDGSDSRNDYTTGTYGIPITMETKIVKSEEITTSLGPKYQL